MPYVATSCRVLRASLCRVRSCIPLNPFSAWIMQEYQKGVSHPLPGFRMVSCEKIKRDRASVASPAPFEIPARSLSRRTRRTAFSGFGSDRTPALRSEINLPSANSVFLYFSFIFIRSALRTLDCHLFII